MLKRHKKKKEEEKKKIIIVVIREFAFLCIKLCFFFSKCVWAFVVVFLISCAALFYQFLFFCAIFNTVEQQLLSTPFRLS